MHVSPTPTIKWSIFEVVSFAVTIAAITSSIILWSLSNFQSKDDAVSFKNDIDNRVSKVESDVQTIRNSTTQISVDVSYIRGRLEPSQSRNR